MPMSADTGIAQGVGTPKVNFGRLLRKTLELTQFRPEPQRSELEAL